MRNHHQICQPRSLLPEQWSEKGNDQSWGIVAALALGSRHIASVQIHAIKWMSLPPMEVGTGPWSLCCFAIQKPEPPHLCLTVETAEVPPLSHFCLPVMTFISALAETGPHVESEEVWEVETLALSSSMLQREGRWSHVGHK